MNRFVFGVTVALFVFAAISCTREKPSTPLSEPLPQNIALQATPTSITIEYAATPTPEPTESPVAGSAPTLVIPFAPLSATPKSLAPANRPGSYTVQFGDWLSKISRQFGVTNEALLAANPKLNPNLLVPGQVLNIPGVGGVNTPASAPNPNPTSTPAATNPPSSSGPTTYTVQWGDWLSKIARQFGVTNQAILTANPNLNPNLLVPGQVLTIPGTGAGATSGAGQNPTPAITAIPSRTPTPRPAATAAPVSSSGQSGLGYGAQLNWTNVDNNSEMDWINGMGFKWAKVQVRWCDFEGSPGNINYGQMDQLIGAASAKGVKVMYSVVCAPNWSRADGGAGGSGPPDDMQKAADFMGNLAGKYCGGPLGAIEVWNEHNLQTEWHGKPISAVSYIDMLRRSYAAIKSRCPFMVVVSGAPTPTGVTNDVAIDDVAFLQQMYANGLKQYADAIGAHPSGFCNSPDAVEGATNPCGGQYNNHRSFFFKRTLESYRAVMVQNGDSGKKIWATEFGWGVDPTPKPGYEYERSLSDDLQAQWLTKAFQMMKSYGYVGVAFVWNLDFTDMGNETGAFHILSRAAYGGLASTLK